MAWRTRESLSRFPARKRLTCCKKGETRMKQGVTYGPGQIGVAEAADPVPGPGEVVLRVSAAGICGSDLHFHRRKPEAQQACRPLGGHEFCGRVTAVGEGVSHVAPGARVGVE